MEKDSTGDHLRAIISNGIITAEMVGSNGKGMCMVHQSSSKYGGTRSAINHVYIMERVQMPEILKIELSNFIAEMDRTVITE